VGFQNSVTYAEQRVHAQGVLATLHVDPDDQVGDLDRHRTLVPNLDPDPIL
jgi:hypothetical protein